MTFIDVVYVLTYANGKTMPITRQHLNTGDNSEIEWVANSYLEVNQPEGCVRVVATKNGAVIADLQPTK